MSGDTPLGDRMKLYEAATRHTLPRRTYSILRVDGRAFHTYLRGAEKPFDLGFVNDMNAVATALCEEVQGARFAYVQSDEISVLYTDFGTTQSQPWFNGSLAKQISIGAATATAVLNQRRPGRRLAQFDARVFTINDPVEVANYFLWRQRDAVTNSIQMVGQTWFSQSQLHGKSTNDIQEMLFQRHNINWNDFDDGLKRGRVVARFPITDNWQVSGAPHFKAEPDNWLATAIPPLPSLRD